MKKMKKKITAHTILFIISALFQIAFVVRLIGDGILYDKHEYSAPFYVFVLVRFWEFMIPAALTFVIGIAAKTKARNDIFEQMLEDDIIDGTYVSLEQEK